MSFKQQTSPSHKHWRKPPEEIKNLSSSPNFRLLDQSLLISHTISLCMTRDRIVKASRKVLALPETRLMMAPEKAAFASLCLELGLYIVPFLDSLLLFIYCLPPLECTL